MPGQRACTSDYDESPIERLLTTPSSLYRNRFSQPQASQQAARLEQLASISASPSELGSKKPSITVTASAESSPAERERARARLEELRKTRERLSNEVAEMEEKVRMMVSSGRVRRRGQGPYLVLYQNLQFRITHHQRKRTPYYLRKPNHVSSKRATRRPGWHVEQRVQRLPSCPRGFTLFFLSLEPAHVHVYVCSCSCRLMTGLDSRWTD